MYEAILLILSKISNLCVCKLNVKLVFMMSVTNVELRHRCFKICVTRWMAPQIGKIKHVSNLSLQML